DLEDRRRSRRRSFLEGPRRSSERPAPPCDLGRDRLRKLERGTAVLARHLARRVVANRRDEGRRLREQCVALLEIPRLLAQRGLALSRRADLLDAPHLAGSKVDRDVLIRLE